MPRDNRSTTISPEIRERRKIMSRMTPDEKKHTIGSVMKKVQSQSY